MHARADTAVRRRSICSRRFSETTLITWERRDRTAPSDTGVLEGRPDPRQSVTRTSFQKAT